MSYKLLLQFINYKNEKEHYTSEEQIKIEKQLKKDFVNLPNQKGISKSIIKFIDDINNS